MYDSVECKDAPKAAGTVNHRAVDSGGLDFVPCFQHRRPPTDCALGGVSAIEFCDDLITSTTESQ